MFWQEEDTGPLALPDDVVDLSFALTGRTLPVDHAFALWSALHRALQWLAQEPRAGVHQIHVAETGNGWYRPEDEPEALLHLSRRTRMILRLPRTRLDQAGALCGVTLDVDGHPLQVGPATVRPLNPLPTLFSRYVVSAEEQPEEEFLREAAVALRAMGMPLRKVLCGRSRVIGTPSGRLFTRSLLLADLDPQSSVQLQRLGLGRHRELGCGLFVPHKGIAPVRKSGEE
jgi:CRISPR-associated protein Cas6